MMWYPVSDNPASRYPGAAAGVTAVTAFRCVRRWQATRATPKEERDAPLPPEWHASTFTHIASSILDLGGAIIAAALTLTMGAQVSAALHPVLERAAAPYPGGHLMVAGHLVVVGVAVDLCGPVFAVVVTNGFLWALTAGLRDWELPRVAQYFWACLPYVIALSLSGAEVRSGVRLREHPRAAHRLGDLDRQPAGRRVQQSRGAACSGAVICISGSGFEAAPDQPGPASVDTIRAGRSVTLPRVRTTADREPARMVDLRWRIRSPGPAPLRCFARPTRLGQNQEALCAYSNVLVDSGR